MNQPQAPLQNSLTPNETDRYPPDVNIEDNEYSAWESQMAQLVGLEEESLKSDATEVKDFDREQLAPEVEEDVSAKPSFSSNPFAKLGLVGSATLIIVVLVGAFLSQIMNIGQTKPKQNEFIAASELQEQPTTESYMQQLEEEVEVLKTKLALAKQAEAAKKAQQTLKQERPKPKETLQENSNYPRNPTPLPTPALPPTVAPTVNEPRVVYVERPATQPALPSLQTTETDPYQEWTRLAKLGSYGQVPIASEPQIAQRAPNPTSEPRFTQQAQNPTPESRFTQQARTSLENLPVEPARRQNSKFVAVGSSAKAVLATAVFGETTNSSAPGQQEEETVFVANLKEPLKASNGEIALPVDTRLLVQVGSLSERGLMRLKVVKVITEDNGILSERSLPSNAITINAPQGKPLLAEKFTNKSGSITLKDTQLFLLGGIGKAAELYNRNDTDVVTINGSSTIVSSDRSQRDLPAGVVQGGIETLAPKLAQRNEQQISQMLQRTNVWLISAGTKVELYVNKDIQL